MFIHSQNADMSEQRFIEEKVGKPPCAAWAEQCFLSKHPNLVTP